MTASKISTESITSTKYFPRAKRFEVKTANYMVDVFIQEDTAPFVHVAERIQERPKYFTVVQPTLWRKECIDIDADQANRFKEVFTAYMELAYTEATNQGIELNLDKPQHWTMTP